MRAYRVLAFKHILEQQQRGPASLRGADSSLLLTAAAPWFLNGLHSVPDNGPCSRDLMGKILPLVNREDADIQALAYPASHRAGMQPNPLDEDADDSGDDELDLREDALSVHSALSDDEVFVRPGNFRNAQQSNRPETLPYNPYGIVFLREIRLGEGIIVPRFRDISGGMITPKTVHYIFGIKREDIDSQIFLGRMPVPQNPRRISNKTRSTATRITTAEPEEPIIFNLAARGYHLPPLQHDEGSDIGEIIDLTDNENDSDMEGDIDKKLTQLWRQFLVDVTAKVPNRKGAFAPSYCILSKFERDNVNQKTYQNLNLRAYFDNCQYRTATRHDWNAAFDKCWPLPGTLLTAKTQNYPKMKYYVAWGLLINSNQSTPVEAMRRSLHERFFELKWIPNFQADRVWYTKRDPTFKRFPEADPTEAAPRILIRWDAKAIV